MRLTVDEMLDGTLKQLTKDTLNWYDPYCEYTRGALDVLSELRTRLNIPDNELEKIRAEIA